MKKFGYICGLIFGFGIAYYVFKKYQQKKSDAK